MMTNAELVAYLTNNKKSNGALCKLLKTTHNALYNKIVESWQFAHDPKNFVERVYQFITPTNIVCKYGNTMKFEYFSTGYICKKSCQCSKDKKANTMLLRHGVVHALQSEESMDKFKNTLKHRYGADTLHEAFAEQRNETNIRKYGTNTPLESKQVRQHIKDTHKKHTGVEYPFQNSKTQHKIQDIILDKYGVSSILALEETQHKAKAAILNKYGVTSVFALASFQEARKVSWMNKYGVAHPSQRHIAADRLDIFHNDELFIEKYNEFTRVAELADYFGVGNSSIHNRAQLLNLPKKYNNISLPEHELFLYVQSLVGIENVEQSNRYIIAPKELDIVIPSKRIAIEFNGLYFHSSRFNGYKNHINKTEAAERAGYRLIHIFEDEWRFNKTQVKSRLKVILHCAELIQIGARKCKISAVESTADMKMFMNNNHIQGFVGSTVNIGLYFESALVCAASFGKPRFSTKYTWELLRLATKDGYHIPGGASRLISNFCKHHKGILVSYADRRWSQGNVYKKLGFEFVHNTGPGFQYVINSKRHNRQKFQKHKLSLLFEDFDSTISAEQNLIKHDIYKIYDCGNSVWKRDII